MLNYALKLNYAKLCILMLNYAKLCIFLTRVRKNGKKSTLCWWGTCFYKENSNSDKKGF